jgi:hypothetical protein
MSCVPSLRRYPRRERHGLIKHHAPLPAHYNPGLGLRTVAVAEAGEKYWARAKDATRLFTAIEAKVRAQADYVVWRDSNARPAHRPKNSFRAERVLPDADPGDVTAHRWRKRLCSTSNAGTMPDPEKIAAVLAEARLRCICICEQQSVYGTVRGTEGTGEIERYTPSKYVEAVREVLDQIDVDPSTCEQAQQTVKAKTFFTMADDGLQQEWHGRIFLNPPFHRDLLPRFVRKLAVEIEAGHVTQAILLVNNCTDTDWFNAALRVCSSVCFTHGRVHFIQASGVEMGSPTHGQAFLYFGTQPDRFEEVFDRIGPCLRPSKHYEEAEQEQQA